MTTRLKFLIEFIVVLALCYFPLAYRIDALSIRQWDEARNAVHTVEMLQNHNYLVRTYQGVPETWEPKPPLLIWLQVISAKIFGLNELAIRFPVILACFMTVILLIIYFARFHNNRYIGYIAALVLVTSHGYIDRHIARTGDHDALLILLTTAIILHTYQLLISDKPRRSEFIGIAILFILAIYTKSAAIIMIIPGLFISVFVFKAGAGIFRNKWFYLSILLIILATGSYYIAREMIQPGYLKAVWEWELFPRYANTENRFDSGTFWYYANNIFKTRFTYWVWFLIPAVIILPFLIKDNGRKFFHFILLNTVILFIFLSSGSKGLWYDGPLFPFFAIIIAMFLHELFMNRLSLAASSKISERKKYWLKAISSVMLLALFVFPFYSIINKVSRSTEYPWDKEYFSMSYILRNPVVLESLPDPLKVVFEGYDAHLLFYVKAVNYNEKRERLISGNFSTVRPGDDIMISQQQVMDSITSRFNYRIISEHDPVKVIRILAP